MAKKKQHTSITTTTTTSYSNSTVEPSRALLTNFQAAEECSLGNPVALAVRKKS